MSKCSLALVFPVRCHCSVFFTNTSHAAFKAGINQYSMQKSFQTLIEIAYWIAIFFSPVLLFSVIAGIIFISNENNLWISIIFLSVGIILGIVWAERVRKKYGCSRYMGRILSTPDICQEDSEENKDKK